jgi:uncharacterized membrane protein
MPDAFAQLLATQPVVFVHLAGALVALLLGPLLLLGRKGRTAHRVLGWTWVLAMATSVVSSAFIESDLPSIGGIGPIHALTLLVAVMLPMGVMHARQGRATAHRKTMQGLYLGACVGAGVFTLLPGRFLGQMLWA